MGVVEHCAYGVGSRLASLTIPYHFSVGEFIAVCYSLVPNTVLTIFAFGWFWTRRLSFFLLLAVGLLGSGINEFGLNKIHKEDRPSKSCMLSAGAAFPSGHAVNAMGYFVWCSLETITRSRWSWKRKIFLIFVYAAVFIPVGPLRTVIHDHTWKQIGVGMAAGAIWGFVFWIITRWILAYFLLEFLMSWKFFRVVFKNDYDPDFERSRWKGEKYRERMSAEHPKDKKTTKRWSVPLVTAGHLIFITLILLLGILGIIIGVEKKHRDPDCDIAAPEIMITAGCLCILSALILTIPALLVLRKLTDKTWSRTITKYLLFASGFFLAEAGWWSVVGVSAANDSDNCPSGGREISWGFLVPFFAVVGTLLVVITILSFFFTAATLYGSEKSADPVGKDTEKGIKSTGAPQQTTVPATH